MIKTTKKSKRTAANLESPTVRPVTAQPVKIEPAVAAPPRPEPVKIATARAEAAKVERICLELVQPEAKAVYVAGSFNEWKPEKTPLTPQGNGHWVGNLTVNPGRYEYLFVVDGQWLPDPNAKESVANPFGGKNSVLTVSE